MLKTLVFGPSLKAILAWMLCAPDSTLAQQQFGGLCARVKIEIQQELAIERIGFEATLEVTNNDEQDAITEFFAELTFEELLFAADDPAAINDASPLFFVRAPRLQAINDIAGAGVIGPTKTAVVKWFIIPKLAAGGTAPDGIRYQIGCRLSGNMSGVPIPPDVLLALPDTITVRPEPQLEITYFQPRDVQGDDPFTPNVESPIPFTLGVLVKNGGYGFARKVKIDSQQPRIVENEQNLLLVAQLLGARVNDLPLDTPSLLVNLGDIAPGECRKGAWDMITSLSGEFVEFKASYTHDPGLGGEDTSVIKSIDAHFIAREVLNEQPGRDQLKDFLADTDRDEEMIPDALFESEGNVLPVNHLTNAVVAGSGLDYTVTVEADHEGWCYVRLPDPGQGRWNLERVVRSDGRVLNPNNAWTHLRYARTTNARLTYLNLFDRVQLGIYTYAVTYAPPLEDNTPPVTTLHFAGGVTRVDDLYCITPDTQMYFLAEDQSPVSIYYSLTNSPFLPALPFRIPVPGTYDLGYYSVDTGGNREETRTATLVLVDDPPVLETVALINPEIVVAGDAASVRPARTQVDFTSGPSPTPVDAEVEIFAGVVGWPTLAGIPSSPTRETAVALTVGGEHVDYYRYRVDQGAWSNERSVTQRLELSALAPGAHTVFVLARSRHGGYLPEADALEAAWRIDPAAPPTRIAGLPATPTRERSATLTLSGEGLTAYRWNLNDSYYRAETPVAEPIALSRLPSDADQVVAVLGRASGIWQPTNNPTTVTWRIDSGYGGDCSALARVRRLTFADIGTAPVRVTWDGRGDDGALQTAGWYTLKITLRDPLGRSTFVTRLVHLGAMSPEPMLVAGVERGPRHPDARGRWAVWQDQSGGNLNVYAMDLGHALPAIVPVTSSSTSQEDPRTDGHYCVWQSRAPDGNWDVWIADLESGDPPQAVTQTTFAHEIKPVIEWPWVVYQAKPVAQPDAPWQLRARNLLSQQESDVDPGPLDQQDASLQGGRVVWQDHRDVGYGEIYFADLETGERRRVTTNTFGQYFPAISGDWIVWQDNRHGQVDLYGFDLRRDTEIRITQTPENEAHPRLDGPWLVCEEDSLGVLTANLRLIHLGSLRAVPLSRDTGVKRWPALASRWLVWEEQSGSGAAILRAEWPALQAVFENQNAIPITGGMASQHQTAFSLLELWHQQAAVTEIVHYEAFVPHLTSRTARWSNDAPAGDDFALIPGAFLWVRFDHRQVLDLGGHQAGAVNLPAGINSLSYTAFPSEFRAFRLLRELGLERARAVRMLEAESGRWVSAAVVEGRLVGEDFPIPKSAMLLIEMAQPVNGFQPE